MTLTTISKRFIIILSYFKSEFFIQRSYSPAPSVLFVPLAVVWVVTSCVVDTTLLVAVVVGSKVVVTALVDFGKGVVVVVLVLALVELEIIVVVEAVEFSDKEMVVIRDCDVVLVPLVVVGIVVVVPVVEFVDIWGAAVVTDDKVVVVIGFVVDIGCAVVAVDMAVGG